MALSPGYPYSADMLAQLRSYPLRVLAVLAFGAPIGCVHPGAVATSPAGANASLPAPSSIPAPVATPVPIAAPAPTGSTTSGSPAPTAVQAAQLPIPAANSCVSRFDQFYAAEPGVYAFWALCEPGINANLYDYAGSYDFNRQSGTWGSGQVVGGQPSPVNDGESASRVAPAMSYVEAQDLPLNTHAGTVAAWVSVGLPGAYPATAVFLGSVVGASQVALTAQGQSGNVCFGATFGAAAGTPATVTDNCTTAPDRWHRLVMTWSAPPQTSAGTLSLYVDGSLKATAPFSGALDNSLFFYRLFPGCCNSADAMSLAKVVIANQAWSASQVQADSSPVLPTYPTGGVSISTQPLGTIHADILGYQDNNSNLLAPDRSAALMSGLSSAGMRSLRYGSGTSGILADTVSWNGSASCAGQRGVTTASPSASSGNRLDTYLPQVAQPLNLHIGYTVNYGSNPPYCDAGGDPNANGAALVDYANNLKHYGIRYWEIGNEQYNGGSSELDLHPHPADGVSYAGYENSFYSAMKAKDPTIQIGVPIGFANYGWQTKWDLPVLQSASYDAIVWHNYPMQDPITDGATLYGDRVASNLLRTRGALLALGTELLNAGKSPDSIWVTEWDGDVQGNLWSQQSLGAVMPLFAATQLAEYMQAGVPYAAWLAQGSGSACLQFNFDYSAPNSYSWLNCGGTFLTYEGAVPGEIAVGLKPGDLAPAAHAFQLLSQSGFVQEGEHMLRVFLDTGNAPWLQAYAATHGSGTAVLLINRDRDNAHAVPVQLGGAASGTSLQTWTYGRAQYDSIRTGNWEAPPVQTAAGVWTGPVTLSLPPWSITVAILK